METLNPDLENFSVKELQQELEERSKSAHRRRQARVYRGECEDSTDGDSHIEANGGIFRGERVGGCGS